MVFSCRMVYAACIALIFLTKLALWPRAPPPPPRARPPPPARRRRGNPPGGVPPQLSPVRIHGHCARHGDLLGDLLQGRLDSLYRRHRNPIFPSRLPVAGNGAPGRYAHGRMAVPRARMEHRRRRDARRVAHDSRRHHCNRYTRFTP